MIGRYEASYILPIRTRDGADIAELTEYLGWLAQRIQLIVVDGSSDAEFARHAEHWRHFTHVAPAPNITCANGKVRGVLTGLDLAEHELLVIADEDVRYDGLSLGAVLQRLETSDLVRPQNYFKPSPWHARWDTARTLINRVTGGDWPGTLAVRKSVLQRTGGYNGDALFENLELVRTVKAAGGKVVRADDVFVRRLPPTVSHFFNQRVRQAYDEFARPHRMAIQLALLPTFVLVWLYNWRYLALLDLAAILTAEAGRWKSGGRQVFPLSASLMAPLWLTERAICAWLALGSRLVYGGIRYANTTLREAATPERELRERLNSASPGPAVHA